MINKYHNFWAVIKDSKLLYYKNIKSKYTTGVINFQILKTKIELNKCDSSQFELFFEGYKSLKFNAMDKKIGKDWHDVI